jgi:hypothetical protein
LLHKEQESIMKILLHGFTLLAAVLLAPNLRAETWNFENDKPGKLPPGWTADRTGKGPGSVWEVRKDATAPSQGKKVLAQVSPEGQKRFFNLCVCDKTKYGDLDFAIHFKAVAGKIDQGGGPVWRYRDHDNYYIARMNPLEHNFRVYKVVGGKRTQLATVDLKIPAGQWHEIRVLHVGDHIRCYLDSKLHLDVRDKTFAEPGKIGLWSKADAVTFFTDLTVQKPKPQPR